MDLTKDVAENINTETSRKSSRKKTDTRNTNSELYSAHDAFFRKMMANKPIAKDFLNQHLPESILKIIKYESLEQMPDTFIQQNLRRSHCDLLYKVQLGDRKGYLYTLVEHQSTMDSRMPLRIWKYILQIMEKYVTGKQEYPLVVPIVIYNGKNKYNKPTSLTEMINAKPEIVENILGDIKPFQLIDLNEIDDEKLRNETWSGIMQYVMKHIFKQNLQQYLEILMPNLKLIVSYDQDSNIYIETMIHYIINCSGLENDGVLSTIFSEGLTEEYGEMAMVEEKTLRYKWLTEGREEGLEEGRMLEQKEIAINLLKLNTSIEFISKATSLSIEEIQALQE